MKHLSILLFVLFAVAFSQVAVNAQTPEKKDDKPPYYMTDDDLDKKLEVAKDAKTPETFIWVIYFHRVPGCDTCQLMSKYVYETIETKFKDDIKSKDILLRYRNFEEKENEELVKKLKVQSPSLAIIVVKDGKLVKAKMATKIWSLAADKKKFIEYVAEEIDGYKKELAK